MCLLLKIGTSVKYIHLKYQFNYQGSQIVLYWHWKVWPGWTFKSFCVGFPAQRPPPLQSSPHSTKLSGINHWGPALPPKLSAFSSLQLGASSAQAFYTEVYFKLKAKTALYWVRQPVKKAVCEEQLILWGPRLSSAGLSFLKGHHFEK